MNVLGFGSDVTEQYFFWTKNNFAEQWSADQWQAFIHDWMEWKQKVTLWSFQKRNIIVCGRGLSWGFKCMPPSRDTLFDAGVIYLISNRFQQKIWTAR